MSSRTGSQTAGQTDSREEGQEQEDFRDWSALPAQVLQQVLQHGQSAALCRPAHAVCSSWRAAIDINAHVRQAYCDVADVRLLRTFTGLKSVIIDEVDFFGRLMRQRQQRRWALPQQQQPQIPQPFIPSDPINRRSTVESSTTITTTSSSSSAGRRSRRRLQQTPLAQHLAGLGRLGMFGPPRLDLAPLAQLPGLQDITLRCVHLVKQLPLHAEHLTHVTSLTLHRMHALQKKRVDDLPRALLPLRNLRRLALIGIEQKSAVRLLVPCGTLVHHSVHYLAQLLMDTAGTGGTLCSGLQRQWQQQVDGGPEPHGNHTVQHSPLLFLDHLLHNGVGDLDTTELADASSPTEAAAAAAVAAAADAAADAAGLTSSGSRRYPVLLPPKRLPCPWLGNLQCLVLRSCGLTKLPAAAVASLTAVTSLDLSNNRLKLLPPRLAPLKHLQVLILDNNNSMRRDEEGVPWFDLPELTYLSLSSCPNLMGYALALYQLVGLQRLGAADNGTAPVGSSLDGCSALKVLDVRGTRIGRSLSAALIHQLPALQRCLYGPRHGGKWVAAVRRATLPTAGLEMVRDPGWVGTHVAQKDQDFWGHGDWVDQEASSGSGSSSSSEEDSEEEVEQEEEGSSESEEGEDGSEGGSSEEQTDSEASSAFADYAFNWEIPFLDQGAEEEADEEQGCSSWDEVEDET